MDPNQNPFIKKSGYMKEDANFVYYRDNSGKVQKIPKYNPEADKVFRLSFLERPYLKWKRLQTDQKSNLITFILFLTVPFIVYKSSLYLTERDIIIRMKARLPEQVLDKSSFQDYLKRKKDLEEDQKTRKQSKENN